jgi:hypothetical protein
MSGSHCIAIIKKRFHMMCSMVASTGTGAEGAGHHMWAKMLKENEVETMQEAAMNIKKYLKNDDEGMEAQGRFTKNARLRERTCDCVCQRSC